MAHEPSNRLLTVTEFQQLAAVPAGIAWFANVRQHREEANPKRLSDRHRRFHAFVGIRIPEVPERFSSFVGYARIERVKTAMGITGPSLPTEHQAIIAANNEVGAEAARTTSISMLVPGVMLQPSGIFAIVRAPEAGAQFVRAS